MGLSSIEWTDVTWNPATGCTKVSPGCAHCYAEAIAPRSFRGRPFTEVKFHPERLNQPLGWRKPRRVFVNSMSDLFHESLTVAQIYDVFEVMRRCPQHVFQVLTKRPERMRSLLRGVIAGHEAPLPNVWLGVSVENQAMADERIPLLLDTPAALRFLSVEPLLGPVDLSYWLSIECHRPDWVIVGGESGPKARACPVDAIRAVVKKCRAAGVSVFVKQLGAQPVIGAAGFHKAVSLRDRKGGNPDEWPADLRVREFPV